MSRLSGSVTIAGDAHEELRRPETWYFLSVVGAPVNPLAMKFRDDLLVAMVVNKADSFTVVWVEKPRRTHD